MTSGAWKHPPRQKQAPHGAGILVYGPLLGMAIYTATAIIFHAVKAAIQYLP